MQTILAAISDNLTIFLAGCVVVVFLISRLKVIDEVIYAVLSLVSFIAFIGYVVVEVPAIDLTIVVIVVSVMIAVDFFLGIRESMKGNGSGSGSSPPI
jgi:hypothetical protein